MLKKIILTLAILLTSYAAHAAKAAPDELEARAGDVVIRLAGKECTNKKVLDQIKVEYHKQFKKAEIRHRGTPTAGCWTIDQTGVYVIFEDGSQGYVPPEVFKPVETL